MPGAQPPGGGRNPGHAKIAAATLLLRARWVVPVEPAGAVLEDHAVAVRDGNIEAVLPSEQAAARFPGYEELVLKNHVLIPGLVNAHTHAAMSLMRGLADDLPLTPWLEKHVWPAEARHVSPQFVRDGTLLACAEMLRGGITCFNDMYYFPESALEAALLSGIRSAQGVIVIEFPSAYASDAEDYLRKGLELRDRYRDEPLASFCLAPHAPYTVSDATFGRIATLGAELEVPVHLHLHESAGELERSLSGGIVVWYIVAERLLLIPPPHRRTGSVGNQPWCVQMIGVDKIHLRRSRFHRHRDHRRSCDHTVIVGCLCRQTIAARRHVAPRIGVQRAGQRGQ